MNRNCGLGDNYVGDNDCDEDEDSLDNLDERFVLLVAMAGKDCQKDDVHVHQDGGDDNNSSGVHKRDSQDIGDREFLKMGLFGNVRDLRNHESALCQESTLKAMDCGDFVADFVRNL